MPEQTRFKTPEQWFTAQLALVYSIKVVLVSVFKSLPQHKLIPACHPEALCVHWGIHEFGVPEPKKHIQSSQQNNTARCLYCNSPGYNIFTSRPP